MVDLSTDAIIIIAFLSFVSFVLLVVVVFLAALLRREREDQASHRRRHPGAPDDGRSDARGGASGFLTPQRGGGGSSMAIGGHFSPRSVERFGFPVASTGSGVQHHGDDSFGVPPLTASMCVGSDLVIGRQPSPSTTMSKQQRQHQYQRREQPVVSSPHAQLPPAAAIAGTPQQGIDAASPRIPPPPMSQPRRWHHQQENDHPHQQRDVAAAVVAASGEAGGAARPRKLVSPSMSSIFPTQPTSPTSPSPRVGPPPAPQVASREVLTTVYPTAVVVSPALSPVAQEKQPAVSPHDGGSPVQHTQQRDAIRDATPPPPRSASGTASEPLRPASPASHVLAADGGDTVRDASVLRSIGAHPSAAECAAAQQQQRGASTSSALHPDEAPVAAQPPEGAEAAASNTLALGGGVGCEHPPQHRQAAATSPTNDNKMATTPTAAAAADTAVAAQSLLSSSKRRCKFCNADLQDPAVLAGTCPDAPHDLNSGGAAMHASIAKAMKSVKQEKKRIQQVLRSGDIETGQRLLDALQEQYMAYL